MASDAARIRFPDLSPKAYEHPTDRAALVALRQMRGFDLVLRRLFGALPERRLRLLYLANAVRVGPEQLPQIDALLGEVCETLDLEDKPDLFLVSDPRVNAMAIGLDEPFIVLNSALVSLLDTEELRCVLGHEAAHILSGHTLYKTMLVLLHAVVRWVLRGPLILPALPVLLALKEWDRKSELSADRAAQLVTQDVDVTQRVMLKLAGGSGDEEYNLAEFERQAAEYREGGGIVDQLLKVMNLLEQSHPFPVLRVVELRKWVESGDYTRILEGDYPRRSEADADDEIRQRVREAALEYRRGLADAPEAVTGFVRNVGDVGRSVWNTLFGELDENEAESSPYPPPGPPLNRDGSPAD